MLVFTILFGALIAMGSILATIGYLSDEMGSAHSKNT